MLDLRIAIIDDAALQSLPLSVVSPQTFSSDLEGDSKEAPRVCVVLLVGMLLDLVCKNNLTCG